MLNVRGNGPHLLARLFKRDAGFQPRHCMHPVIIPRHVLGLEGKRSPQILPSSIKGPGRHDSNDGVGLAIQLDAMANNGGVRSPTVLPDSVAQNHFVLLARLVLIGREGAAQLGLRPKTPK